VFAKAEEKVRFGKQFMNCLLPIYGLFAKIKNLKYIYQRYALTAKYAYFFMFPPFIRFGLLLGVGIGKKPV
jgi:hypothetical protein